MSEPIAAAYDAPHYNISDTTQMPGCVAWSLQCRRQSFRKHRFLVRKDGAQVDDQAVVLNPRNHRRRTRTATQALLHLRGGVAPALDANDFCRNPLGRR